MATIKLTVLSSKMIGDQYPILICISQKPKRLEGENSIMREQLGLNQRKNGKTA